MNAASISFHVRSAPQLVEQSEVCIVQYGRLEDLTLSIFLHTREEARALIAVAAAAEAVLPETHPLYPPLAEILHDALAEIENLGRADEPGDRP